MTTEAAPFLGSAVSVLPHLHLVCAFCFRLILFSAAETPSAVIWRNESSEQNRTPPDYIASQLFLQPPFAGGMVLLFPLIESADDCLALLCEIV